MLKNKRGYSPSGYFTAGYSLGTGMILFREFSSPKLKYSDSARLGKD